jgi:hypothetical protein
MAKKTEVIPPEKATEADKLEAVATQPSTGISLTFHFEDNGWFSIVPDIRSMSDDTLRSLAVFLSILENGSAYGLILEALIESAKQNPQFNDTLLTIIKYKKAIDVSSDAPLMRPSQVFTARNV